MTGELRKTVVLRKRRRNTKEYEEHEEHRGGGGSTEVKRNTREFRNPLVPPNPQCSSYSSYSFVFLRVPQISRASNLPNTVQ